MELFYNLTGGLIVGLGIEKPLGWPSMISVSTLFIIKGVFSSDPRGLNLLDPSSPLDDDFVPRLDDETVLFKSLCCVVKRLLM